MGAVNMSSLCPRLIVKDAPVLGKAFTENKGGPCYRPAEFVSGSIGPGEYCFLTGCSAKLAGNADSARFSPGGWFRMFERTLRGLKRR